MEPNIAALFILTVAVSVFAAWLLYKLYEHDYNKIHKDENNFDHWS